MIVLDASVVVELLLQTADAPRIAAEVLQGRHSLHAPHLIDVEVGQVMRRFVLREEITADHGREALGVLAQMPIRRYPHVPLLPRIWELRANVTAYDAAYIALAEALRAPLVTRDQRLARSDAGTAKVRVI